MMIIDKRAECDSLYKRTIGYYESAREAFLSVLKHEHIGQARDYILVPGYIGFSPREGSGVYDPIQALSIPVLFYQMTGSLEIDIDDLYTKMRSGKISSLLIIHYFGMVDRNYESIIGYAKELGITVIEDAAHAFFSDWVDGSCGRLGDYTIYSLHKMFPFAHGGMLAVNGSKELPPEAENTGKYGNPFQYDLKVISEIRKTNYAALEIELKKYKDNIVPLYASLPANITPQTYPVRIVGTDRFALYTQLNDEGYGVISLYHTMIPELRDSKNESLALSSCILNFPVHQDIKPEQYVRMVEHLDAWLRRLVL